MHCREEHEALVALLRRDHADQEWILTHKKGIDQIDIFQTRMHRLYHVKDCRM